MVVILTMVPETLARRGHRFTFLGPNKGGECDGCPYQKLCFGLRPHHTYQVTALRDVTHPCALHDEGKVRVVEVQETEVATSLEARHLRGTAAHWTPVPCGMPECPQYGFCHPVGPAAGAKMAIVANDGKMDCPAGFDLARVRLRPME